MDVIWEAAAFGVVIFVSVLVLARSAVSEIDYWTKRIAEEENDREKRWR